MELMLTSMVEAVKLLFDPLVILFIVIGSVWGALCGVLPGIASGLAIGVMVPFTFDMNAVNAVVFLMAINVAVSFGNSIPAVLLGLPGSPSAVLTAMDGYSLHKRGQSGLALGLSWYGAVVGQLFSLPFFVLLVVPLSGLTYTFLSPELFALYFLGLTAVTSLTGENVFKGLAAAAFGVAIAQVGPDPVSGVPRFYFDVVELRGGLTVIPVVLGLVTISELVRSMRQSYNWGALAEDFSAKFPPARALGRATRFVISGSVIGTLVGAVPGLSGTAGAVMAYQQAKLTSKHPEEYGKGSIEGLATNESAQNAAQAGEMVPTLGLGIPGSDTMVLLLAALTIQGIVPGPLLMQESPELLYASVGGMLGGSLFLLLLGWQIGKVLLKVVMADRRLVLPLAFVLTLFGVYALNRSVWDLYFLVFFGLIGYFMLRYGYSTAAASIGFILGPGFETNLRQGLLLVNSDPIAFVTRPWTAVILAGALALLAWGSYGTLKLMRREKAMAAELAANEQADRSGADRR